MIPTYNREYTIARAIDSVLNQEYASSEIIVVDDGSNDNTRKILEAYGEKIRYVYQENAGVSAARNRGVNEAKYEWIAFLDSDDYWLPHHLQNIVDAMKATDSKASLYFSDTMLTPDNSESSLWNFCGFKMTDPFLFENDAGEWAFMRRQPMMLQSSIIRRKAYFEVGALPRNMIVAEDTLLFYKLTLRYPACAVRGYGTIMTSDGSERLTRTYDENNSAYWHSLIQLYRELISNEMKISVKYRKILNYYLSHAYICFGRIHLRKRRFLMASRNFLTGAWVSPVHFAIEFVDTLKRHIF
jgi:glycosyltransferase involved in cell wall biosynthesis